MTAPTDDEVLRAAALVLDRLGPFSADTPRSEKWRTAVQLAAEIRGNNGLEISPKRLESILTASHRRDVAAVSREDRPTGPIRRAMRPDLTTTEALWGSTRHHGHVWKGFPRDLRADRPPESGVRTGNAKCRLFLSYCQADSTKARKLADGLAESGISCWMAELGIDYGEDIIAEVREALDEADALVALVTRRFVGSLWCRTELHTALATSRYSLLVLDTTDDRMVELVVSLSETERPDGHNRAFQFGSRELSAIAEDLVRTGGYESVEKYTQRAQGFAFHVPEYLRGGSFINYLDTETLLARLRALGIPV